MFKNKGENKMEKQVLGYWFHLNRAIELAKIGNHSISIHFNEDYENAVSDFNTMKEYYSDWFTNFVKDNADMKIEITKPIPEMVVKKSKYEKISDVNKRIEKAVANETPTYNLCSASQSILKRAMSSLNLSLDQLTKIESVAKTIAKSCNKNNVAIEHIAEAIQYQCVNESEYINVLEPNMNFGGMVFITKGFIDNKTTEKAIQYLMQFSYGEYKSNKELAEKEFGDK
jgi:hypothetical protein